MFRQYLKQAWALLRQNPLFSTLYIVGTGLAIGMTMIVAMIYYVKLAPVYPEENRGRTLYLESAQFKNDQQTWQSALSYSALQDWALHFENAEVISVDSRQVYRYLDVGTDKVSREVRREIKAIKPETESYLKAKQYWRSEEDNYGPRLMKRAMKFIEERDKTHPFLLWVDSFDPHQPWDAPSIWAGEPCPYDPDWDGKANINPPNGGVKALTSSRRRTTHPRTPAGRTSAADRSAPRPRCNAPEYGTGR